MRIVPKAADRIFPASRWTFFALSLGLLVAQLSPTAAFAKGVSRAESALRNVGSADVSEDASSLAAPTAAVSGHVGAKSVGSLARRAKAACGVARIETVDCAHAVTIKTGAKPVDGPSAIDVSNLGAGAVRILTGAGAVNGTHNSGIVASTEQGALEVRVGTGGVGGRGDAAAMDLTSQNGSIMVRAIGDVSANGKFPFMPSPRYIPYAPPPPDKNDAHGLLATSNGAGNILVDGSGAFSGQYGRGIFALQSLTGLGGIVILGDGETVSGAPGRGCCSAIRAEIDNPADDSNILVDRTGDIFAFSSLLPPGVEVSAGIHALTAGSGDITVLTAPGQLIVNHGIFGIDAEAFGPASAGDINVAIGVGSTVMAMGTGVSAANSSFAVPLSARSTVSVINNGLVESGPVRGPAGFYPSAGGGDISMPAGILAGYDGGPFLSLTRSAAAPGSYESCSIIACATLTPNPNVHGRVSIVNAGAIEAAVDGIVGFNFGVGTIVVDNSGAIVAVVGIQLFSDSRIGQTIVNTGDITGSRAAIDLETSRSATTIDLRGGAVVGDLLLSGRGDVVNVEGGSLAGAIIGNGGLGGPNAGAVNFSAASFVTQGLIDVANVNVDGGALTLNDDVVVTDQFVNRATLQLADFGARTITGNYVQTSSGALAVSLGSSAAAGLVVTDRAVIAGALTLVDAGLYSTATRYTVLTADGGLFGRFSQFGLDEKLPFVTPMLSYDPTSAIVGFAQTASFPTAAATPNQVATATALQALGAGSPLFQAVSGQSVAGTRTAFDALSGEIHPSAASAAFEDTRLPREAVLDRLASPYDAAPPGEAGGFAAMNAIVGPDLPTQNFGGWGRAFGSFGHIGGDGDAATLERAMDGFILGLDATLDERYRLGAAAGYTQSTLDLEAPGSSGSVESIFGGLYGGESLTALQLRGGAFYAYNRYDTGRSVAFPGFGDTDSAGYSGETLQAFGEAGWRGALPGLPAPSFVEPFAGALAMRIATPNFSEAGGAAALDGAAGAYDYGATTLGLRGEAALFAGAPLLARAMLGWQHVFGDVTPTSMLAFASAPTIPFNVAGAPVARDALLIETGFDWRLSTGASLGVFYSGALGRRDEDNAVEGRLEIAF